MKEKVIIFSAPSGAGKTTIVKHILSLFPELEFSISACSREKRPGETDGKDYYFITPAEFREKVSGNEFIEWEEVYEGCFYGTLKSELTRLWQQHKIIVFDVDVKGGINLKRIFGDKARSVFISPPDLVVLEARLRNRQTESEESLNRRLSKAGYEMQFVSMFDVCLVNDSLQKTLEEAEDIVRKWISD